MQPRLKIKLTPADRIVELISTAFVLLMVRYAGFHYPELPDVIPRHYNAVVSRQPDRFSQKAILWTLPFIGLILYN